MEREERSAANGMPDDLQNAIQRCLERGDDAFAEIVEAYERQIYSLAYRMLGDPEEARDATQDVFIKVHRTLDTFRFQSKFSSWVYRVAMNTMIDYRTAVAQASAQTAGGCVVWRAEPSARDRSGTRGTGAPGRARGSRTGRGGDTPDKPRAALVLRDLQGLSYTEISEVLGITEGTVASRLNEARKQLTRRLRRSSPAPGESAVSGGTS